MRSMLRTAVASALMAGIALSPALSAGEKRVIEGCYVPIRGFAETASYSELAQLGQYRLVLIRKDSHDRKGEDRALRRVVIKGPLRGVITNPEPLSLLLKHVLGTEERDGFIYTAKDTFETNDVVPCEGGGGVILEGDETIKPVRGTGRFAGLRRGGSLVVTGTVNTCTGLNDFEVVPGEGEICFDAPKDWAGPVTNIWEGYVGLYGYAFSGNPPVPDKEKPLDLDNDDQLNADYADVHVETLDANRDKDAWGKFAGLAWTTKICKPLAFQQDPSL